MFHLQTLKTNRYEYQNQDQNYTKRTLTSERNLLSNVKSFRLKNHGEKLENKTRKTLQDIPRSRRQSVMPRNTNQTNNHVIKQNLFERIESEVIQIFHDNTRKRHLNIPVSLNGRVRNKDEINKIRNFMHQICITRVLLISFTIFLVYLELNFPEERPAYPGDFHLDVTLIRLINLFTTLIYLILNHIFHLQRVKLYQNEENRMINIFQLIYFFNAREYIPGLDIEFYIDSFGTSTKYKIGMLIAVVQFLKFTPYFDLVLLTSRYTNAQGSKICFNNGILADMLFQFKVNMRLRPLQILIAAYLFGILIFGFTILILMNTNHNRFKLFKLKI